MDNREAIEQLKQALNGIPALREKQYDNQDYKLWLHNVETIIKNALDSDDYKTFVLARIQTRTRGMWPESAYQEDYQKQLTSYETALTAIIQKYEVLGIGTPESQVTRPRFSTRTLGCVVEILARRTDTDLRNFFFKYNLLDIYQQSGELTAKKRKVNDIFQHLLYRVGDKSAVETLDLIVREALKDIHVWLEKRRGFEEKFSEEFPDLERALSADGFQVHEGELIPVISPIVEPAKEEGLIEKFLNKYGFAVAKNHLEQSYDNYLDGNWEAANAALRSFLQDVFDQIALIIAPEEAASKEPGGKRRKLLEEKGFIEADTESKLVSGFFKFAGYKGSHPGISNESDCRLRRYMAVALASYYLEKLGKINV